MTFGAVLAPAIEMAATASCSTNGWPSRSEREAAQVPDKRAGVFARPHLGSRSDLHCSAAGTMLGRLVEAEQEAMRGGRRAALKAARDRFYTGDID